MSYDLRPRAPSHQAISVRQLLRTGAPSEQAFGRCSGLSDEQIDRVCALVGGFELAAVALRLRPWPPWLHDVLFPPD